MGMGIKIDLSGLKIDRMGAALKDEATWMYAAQQWHRLYSQYVPRATGTLAQTVTYGVGEITHTVPYAHYQYMGEVYGDNYPIMQGGVPVGFYSKAGVAKHRTGRALSQNGQPRWDEYAAAIHGNEIMDDVCRFLLKRMEGG